jgi:cobaltochelatase CobT
MNKNEFINKIKEDVTAINAAILKDEEVVFDFNDDSKNNFFSWNQNLIFDEKRVSLPAIKINEFNEDSSLIEEARASSDMALCYLMFHNKELHFLENLDENYQKLFDEFEKIRVIAKARDCYLGIVKNILKKIENDLLTNSGDLSLILLKYIFPNQIAENTTKTINNLSSLVDLEILEKIKYLSFLTNDQEAFKSEIARLFELMEKKKNPQESKKEEFIPQNKQDVLENFGSENVESDNEQNLSGIEEDNEVIEPAKEDVKSLIEKKEITKPAKSRVIEQEISEEKIEFRNPYKIFTNQFDEVIFPQKLIAKNELQMLRDQLDLKIAKLSSISKKISLKLKRKLLSRRIALLENNSSNGVLDRKRLVGLVIDPNIEDIWINNKNHEYNDTALTILLDNSGSMRGNPIVMAALACEIIAEILEKFSVKTEIIGFTTGDWKGGRARKLWEAQGKPNNPGRLNELRHIIYKSFNQNFRKAKINLGLMLKEGTLKENIDGEALLFARSRLMQQDQKRKILMVISDGTPVDDSTISVNSGDILSDHLRHVINKIEQRSDIEIIGVGIGHTTEDFYRNSITVRSLEELGDAMIEKIAELL